LATLRLAVFFFGFVLLGFVWAMRFGSLFRDGDSSR